MTSMTAAGTTIAISAALPPFQSAGGYASLAFIEIGQVEKVGALGATFAKAEFQPLKGPKQKYKASNDNGTLTPIVALDGADAGQALLRTASDDATQKLYSFRLTYPDGSLRYFLGRVLGMPEAADGADTMLTGTPTIEIVSKVVRLAAGETIPEPTATITFGQSVVSADEGGVANFPLIAERNGVAGALTGTFVVEPDPASANPASAADFPGSVFPSGSATIAAGSSVGNIAITTFQETAFENDEGYIVKFTYNGVTVSSRGVIVNEDAAPTGNMLPAAALNDISLTRGGTYGNQHVAMNGGVSLPAGDWVMHIACRILSHSYEVPLISIAADAAPAQGYLSNAPNLLLAYIPPGSSRSSDPARGAFILSGRDNAGNWLSPQFNRAISNYWEGWGSGVRYLSGPYNSSADSNAFNSIFIQKKGGRIELWIVNRYSAALLADYAATSFGELTGGAALLGRVIGQGHRAAGFTMQRFFSASGSLTAVQMEAIAQGVDPRQYLAFDQPTDILTAITQLGTAVQPHLVGSGSCQLTASGTADYTAAATPTIPTAVDADMPRLAVEKDQVFQRTGVSSDLRLEGRVTGLDDDIYVQIVDWTTKTTVVKPFALLGRSVNGTINGVLTGVPSALQWYDIQLRKGLNGPVYTMGKRFGVGIVLDWWGQSIAEKMRSSTQTTISGSSAASGFLSFFSRAKSDSGSTQGIQNRGWKQTNTQGYGEVHTARMIAEAAQCPVGGIMSAMEGSGIDAWQRGATSAYIPASDTWQRTRPGYMVWSQGQGSTGIGGPAYTVFLNTFLQQTREDFPWSWKLIMEPLNNNGATANNAGAFSSIRNAQSDWADANAGPRLSNAGGFVDMGLTSGDLVHPVVNDRGQGRIAERIARQVLWMEGVVPTSARGPKITSATRSGAVIDLTVAQNGGTGLRTPNAADITGFRASTSSSFSSLLTISSAVIVNATTIRLTLSADPGAPVYVDYQWGNPGSVNSPLDANGFIPGVTNPVYDDRSPGMNTTLGFPVQFTTANLVAA